MRNRDWNRLFVLSIKNVFDLLLRLSFFGEKLDEELFIDQALAEGGLAIELF